MSVSKPGMRFETAGEVRPPRKGEWYFGITGAAMAERDFDHRALPILRRVDDGVRCEEELDAEGRQETKRQEDASRRLEAVRPTLARSAVPNQLRPIGETARRVKDSYLPYSDPED